MQLGTKAEIIHRPQQQNYKREQTVVKTRSRTHRPQQRNYKREQTVAKTRSRTGPTIH